MKLAVICAMAGLVLQAQPAPQVRFVVVEPGVKLEVLDWGGTGRTVILLGGYLTGHAFEPLARELVGVAHVVSVTRRGMGASSEPSYGYSTSQSAQDVVSVIDALNLQTKPIVAGHSFGGLDLNVLGSRHASRIAGIVYLNSAEDPKLGPDDYGVKPPDPKSLPPAPKLEPENRTSVAAYLDWQQRVNGVRFPEKELRQLYEMNPDGSLGQYRVSRQVRQALFQGLERPAYSKISVPVLAFFAGPDRLEEQLAKWKPTTESQREALSQKMAFDEAIRQRHIADLRRGVPAAKIIEIPKANFYIFLSHPAEIAAAMRSFIGQL
jgi:non-heme chloroperoxidase